ncbi:MAG TPA: SelL-related redox protein [Myxococcota bacterium]
MEHIPEPLLGRYVNGVNLMPGTLRDQLGDAPTLLVFLRYFGCPFCRETIARLRESAQRVASYPPVLFFYQGSPIEGRAFMRRYWPEARAVADPQAHFYDGFGVGRGGFLQLFHPGVLPALVRARAGGHFATDGGEDEAGGGDSRRMPGMFVTQRDQILWAHRARHQADHPEFERIPELAGIATPA